MLIKNKRLSLCFLMSLSSISLHADTKLNALQETNGHHNKNVAATRDVNYYNISYNITVGKDHLEETLSTITTDKKQYKRALPKVICKKLKTNIQEMEKNLDLCNSRYKNTLEKLKEANDNLKQLKEQLNKNSASRISKKETNCINPTGTAKTNCTQGLLSGASKTLIAGGNINIGLKPEDYRKLLKKQENRLLKRMQAIVNAQEIDQKKLKVVNVEIKAIQNKSANLEASYKETVIKLKAADSALDQFKNQLPEAQITKAKNSLQQGNTKEAEEIFTIIIKNGSGSIALAAFQSAQLAEERIDYFKAIKYYKKAVVLDKNNTEYLLNAGKMARKLADYDLAQEWLERLLTIRQAEKKETLNLASTKNELARVYEAQGKYDKAEPLFLQSLSIAEKALDKNHPEVATILDNLAELYRIQGKYNKAEPLFLQSLSIAEKVLGKNHPEVATILDNLAELYRIQGKYDKAEPLYLQSLSITEKALGKGHPSVATTLNNLAVLYKAQGKYDKVEPLYLRSLEIREKVLSKDHPSVATTLNNLAVLYKAQGKYDKAIPLFLKSLSIKEKVLGKDHPEVATTLNNLADLYNAQGKYGKAEYLFLRSLSIKEKALGKDHPEVATTLNNLAVLYYSQKKYKEAVSLLQRALVILKKVFPNGHPRINQLQANLEAIHAKIK